MKLKLVFFLKKNISKDQIDFIELSLKKNSLVKKIHFEPKLIAWEKLQSKLDVEIGSSVSTNPLPDAFFISLNTLDQIKIEKLINKLDGIDGIDDIIIDGNWIKKLRDYSITWKIKCDVFGNTFSHCTFSSHW
jgi:cell division transport system permease protein